MSGRFDYVKYDGIAGTTQASAKELCESLEKYVEAALLPGRAKALALTSIEECYMWIGKAVRDEQIKRNGSAEPQEKRSNS
jgi:hypothetical protein